MGVRPAPEPISDFRRHVGLTLELAITQFRLKYTGSVLGYLWSLLKPLMYFGIMYVVFITIFKLGDATSPEFATQLLLGIVVWTFFAEATSSATGSIINSGNLIRKASFPHVVLVIAATMTAAITFVINLVLMVLVTALIGHLHLGVRSLVAIPLLVELYTFTLGVSLLLAAIMVFYRDLGHLWETFTQMLFYGSAVVFPIAILLDQDGRTKGHVLPYVVGINPVAQIIEDMRAGLVISDPVRVPWMASFDGWLYVVPLVIVAACLGLGFAVFRRLSPRFAEDL